jgi:hypothetical protein
VVAVSFVDRALNPRPQLAELRWSKLF